MNTAPSERTILVAEDEPSVRAYVRNILRAQGFHVIEAADGAEALELVERAHARVDLLLTDIRMPRMDGIALARSLASSDPPPPVIFMSGYPFDVEEAKLELRNACGFVSKPFTRGALVSLVEKCLRPPEPSRFPL